MIRIQIYLEIEIFKNNNKIYMTLQKNKQIKKKKKRGMKKNTKNKKN